MSTVINTNIKSLMAANALTVNGRNMRNTMQSLSTGSRINGAADDAAGLSIRENMTAQIKGLNAAVRNANDAISMLQTADGAMEEQTVMMQRMRELGVLAQNDTYSSAQRTAMQDEFSALRDEIDRIGTDTQWNNFDLLTGDGGNMGGASTFSFQVGANSSQTIEVVIGKQTTADQFSGIASSTVASAASAASAVSALDTAIATLAANRSVIGAGINRLTHAADNAANIAQNVTESRSRVTDTDYAAATSELARTQIIQQAATAILAQANQQPQAVLSLLK
ncbi:MAG: flagellin FliC [Betaproteobacteria bacterium]|nr:flagellin FliC [Betaproteobacteria bacterium]